MKDIMKKLAELEATAPKVSKKKMLKEDSTTPPMNAETKPTRLKDIFETMATTQPVPVVGKQGDTQQTGAGFINVTDNSPAAQALSKAVGDLAGQKKLQIVVPTQPGQAKPGQAPQAGTTPAPAGATGQPQAGATAMREKDEGKPGKNFAKIAKSAGKRYGSKEAGERVAGAVRAKLAKQGKLEEEQLDELSPETIKAAQAKRYGQLNQLAQTGAARAGSTTSFNAKASPQTINQFHDTETKAINRDFDDQQRTSARYDPAERDQALANNERNRTRNMSRGNMLNLANKKLQGTANVPAKSVEEGAKVDRMVKHIEKSERKLGKSKEKASDIAWATANKRGMLDNKNKKKVKEGDIAPTNGIDTQGANLGAGRSQTTLEAKEPQVEVIDNAFNRENYKDLIGKKYPKSKAPAYARVKEISEGAKPDFLDLDKDGNKKEPMKKAAADKKKQKVKESMNHRISAARLEGKSHGLRGHAHCGKSYEDLDEMKAYHEGYIDGLNECYGQGVYETAPAMPAATVPGMASAAMPTMEDDMEEGNAFTAALAKTPKGGKFSVGGKTFTDNSSLEEYAFEAWDRELSNLLNESEEVTEGLSVSVSKGQQNSPDSVTITAQDAEADQLLQLVKHAGLGLFGDEAAHEPSSAMSVQPSHGAPDEVGAGGVDVEVVDGHDGIMGLMQKLSGIQADGQHDADYEDEEGHEKCADCGEANCGCDDKEQVEEVESEDQMEFEVAEDNAPDSETAEHDADEEAEAEEDSALAKAAQQNKTTTVNEGGDGGEASEEGEEDKEGETDEEGETVSESFINLFKKLEMIAEAKEEEEDEEEDVTESKDEEDEGDDFFHNKKVAKDKQLPNPPKEIKIDEWANQVGKGPGKGTDASFEQDIDFMTKVIAGGLNKPKSTGQTTIPVIAGQDDRMHDNPQDWATLAGIKK